MSLVRFFATALFCMLFAPLYASDLSTPTGQVLLTVTGEIESRNTADGAQFDREMLEGLDWQEIRTFTSFTEGEQVFAGPTLASLLERLGVTSGEIKATAINDYSVTFSARDAWAHDVLLAIDHNGKPMRVRSKGPIWVVYPLTEAQAAKNLRDAEMIWQLVRLEIQ